MSVNRCILYEWPYAEEFVVTIENVLSKPWEEDWETDRELPGLDGRWQIISSSGRLRTFLRIDLGNA